MFDAGPSSPLNIGSLKGQITIDTAQAEANVRKLTAALRELDAARYRPAHDARVAAFGVIMLVLGVVFGIIAAHG
jgi:hypothetical protein